MKSASHRPQGGAGFSPGYAARRPVPDARELRRLWVAAVELSADLARDAEAAGEGFEPRCPPGSVARLGGLLRDLKSENFPVGFVAARAQVAAWLMLAGVFANPALGPDSRTLMASFLAAGAHALDLLLTNLRTEEAARDRVRIGEREG